VVKDYINKSWCGTHRTPNLETICKGNITIDLEIDVALTIAIAQTIMRKRYPSCVIESFEPLHGGSISAIYEMRRSKPDLRVILKVYPDTFLSKMEKEVYVYSLLDRAVGLPTPNILWSDDSKRQISN
jgi:hypothetical protein